jgi:filamentous hemagglutinin family protein
MLFVPLCALANPAGMTVASGTVTASQNGPQLTITASQNAFLNWQSFNIAAGETTIFQQPSAQSVVWNRVNDPNPSQIFGSLQANGIVVLMNSAGIYFGPNSYIKTGGLIVSTANCVPQQNSGGAWEFNGPPPAKSIINCGKINVANGGSVFLIAENVANFGEITAPGGTICIAAGQDVLVSERPDGRGLSMKVNLPAGAVDNEGRLVADAGTISVNAQTVNQDGIIQANSVRNNNGVIELVASDKLNLGADSQISASGDASPREIAPTALPADAGMFISRGEAGGSAGLPSQSGASAGGSVTLKSGNTFSDATGSQIDVTGGSQGGNGGSVEISAPSMSAINSRINGQAQPGSVGGTLLLDPDYIVLDESGSDKVNASGSSGTLLQGDSAGKTLYLDVGTSGNGYSDSAFTGLSQITLQAKNDITLADGTAWNLSASTGQSSGQLTLEAGGNIIFGFDPNGQIPSAQIADANNWSVTLDAGYNFVNNTIQSGSGSIYLNGGAGLGGGGSIQMGAGNGSSPAVNLVAGQDITVGSGYVITTGGGSINAQAIAGSIDTGSDAQGYHFYANAGTLAKAYDVNGGVGQVTLGGISTAAGGNVTLTAGKDVTSVLPGNGQYFYDGTSETPNNGNDYLTAGSGAYGNQPGQSGNVTIVAGGNVTGHYLVANGVGSITAGGNAGTTGSDSQPLALSLISGGWMVDAAHDINLQEVRNPNGVFDYNGGSSINHYFNYAPSDYVDLSAGNSVQLGGSSSQLPRVSGLDNTVVIYPSILNIMAGQGGVTLGTGTSPSSLILFPSAQGSLTIDTTGSLVSDLNASGTTPQLFNLIVSDADCTKPQYNKGTHNFGAGDHAASPIHANSPTPIDLNIGGDMNYIDLNVPEAAQITVGGSMNNCGFQGMNVSDASSYQVQIHEADGSTRTVTVDPSVTRLNVAGEIFNAGDFTSVQLSGAQAPDLSLLSLAVGNAIDATTLTTIFNYDPATKILTYENNSQTTLAKVLNLLNSLIVQKVVNGVPQWLDPPYDTQPEPDTANPVSVFGDPNDKNSVAYALLNQYKTLSGYPYALPNNTPGYTVGGGGEFDITAQTINLGTSGGIQSDGVAAYLVRGAYPLRNLFGNGGAFTHGADINITTTGTESSGVNPNTGDLNGDLDMLSSSIASSDGGDISISAGGDINAGSSVFSATSLSARGIYTTAQSDVTVIASGDINLNGSRIATYDGGNITVESLNGSVNVGTGASTPVAVTGYYEDPATHAVYSDSPQLPFSGIVALTFPDRATDSYPAPPATLGNILVEAPNGNITANAAGILQIPLNGLNYPDAITTVLAGYGLQDSSGNPVLAADSRKAVIESLPVPTADLTDPAQTAIVDGTPYQLSATVWNDLLAVLGSPGGSEVVNIHVIGDKTDFLAALLGDGTGLASSINYQRLGSSGKDINVGGSGIIASNARLDASGNINGLIFARDNIDIIAQQNISVTAFGQGNVSVSSSGGSISGTLIGVNGVSASGLSVDASLISANVSGATSGQSGLGQGNAAGATSQGLANNEATQAAAASDQGADDPNKKKGKHIALAQKVSRVTVILPPKKVSETKTSTPGT